jgi:hypothetical protein
MSKSNLNAAALFTASVAGAVALLLVPIGLVRLSGIIGFALLLVLFSYDDDRTRSVVGSLAFSTVAALCLVIAALPVCQFALSVPPMDPQLTGKWLPLIWLVGTIVIWVVDRSRVSSPMPVPTFRPDPAPAPFRPEQAQPRLVRDEPRPEARYEPPAQPVAPPVVQPMTQAVTQPVAPPPPPPVVPVAQPIAPPVSHPVAPPPAPPPPAPIPVPAGKVASIYVNLIGEGLNVLRSVRAEQLGRDYYRIIDDMPEGEVWEFKPGMVVRCRKKNLSSGKAMVAFEEAQRAQ